MKIIKDTHRQTFTLRLMGILCLLSILSVAGCSSTTPRARQAPQALHVAKPSALTPSPTLPQQLAVKPALSASTELSVPTPLLTPKVPAASETSGVRRTGLASWYGPGFHGRITANGEVYNQYGMSAAHKTLPFGSRVRVTNVKTGQSIEVRINDRGPYIRGRIIDLSYTAARKVGIHKPGVAQVHIEVLPPKASAKSS